MSAAETLPPDDQRPEFGDDSVTPAMMPDGSGEVRNRGALAESIDLNPQSLVGSFFHRVENGDIVWAGQIVGEVQAGTYLCLIDSGLEGVTHSRVQIVASLDSMLARDPGYEWRFYDDAESMRAAYAEYLGNRARVDA